MSQSLSKEFTRTKRSQMQLDQKNKNEKQQKPHRKYQQILQLKEEIVKMKNFLHDELPEISKLLPHKSHGPQSSLVNFHEPSNQDFAKILDINRRLCSEKQKLQVQLVKERSLKKQLSRSLKKQQRMVTQLYNTTHHILLAKHDDIKPLLRKRSAQKQLKVPVGLAKALDYSKMGHGASKSIEKVDSLSNIRESKSSAKRMNTETSLGRKIEGGNKDKGMKQTAPCYSTSQQQMISNLQEIGELEKKMEELVKDSQKIENRVKKLQLRNEMERIVSRLNYLKDSLGKAV